MLNIAQPRLSTTEWKSVSAALKDAASCGCGETDRPGSVGGIIGKAYARLTGHARPRPMLTPRQAALRGFVCTTQRTRRLAEDHIPDLIAQGFSRAQIEAIALLTV